MEGCCHEIVIRSCFGKNLAAHQPKLAKNGNESGRVRECPCNEQMAADGNFSEDFDGTAEDAVMAVKRWMQMFRATW